MVADAILGAHPTPSESIWIRHVCPIPKLKSLSWFLILLKTHCRTLIVLESRWVKVPCIFVYLCGGNGETTLDSQSGFPPPLRRGRESSKFRTTLTAAQPRDRKPTTAAAGAAAAAAAVAVQQQQQCSLLRGLGLFSVGVCNNRVSELRC